MQIYTSNYRINPSSPDDFIKRELSTDLYFVIVLIIVIRILKKPIKWSIFFSENIIL